MEDIRIMYNSQGILVDLESSLEHIDRSRDLRPAESALTQDQKLALVHRGLSGQSRQREIVGSFQTGGVIDRIRRWYLGDRPYLILDGMLDRHDPFLPYGG